MKIIIDIPEKTYQKIITGTYDYGDMNVIFQNGTPYEERPHGEWIKKGNNCFCSNCKFELESYILGIFYNFCPNCGASMRKEGEEGAKDLDNR